MPKERILLSVVAPAHNEDGNVERLVEEVGRAAGLVATKLGDKQAFEFILVDDGSTDLTRIKALELANSRPWLRVIAMSNTPEGRGNGQSAAFHAGFRACRGDLIAVLDADLQNDPSDLVAMLDLMRREDADMVQGDRTKARQDSFVRKVGSTVGRLFRRLLLGDSVRDTGCSLRLMKRELALRLPLEFKGMHRFIPVTARRMGFTVVETPVSHRPRTAGETKYGMGILPRAIPGLVDCFAVRWMTKRRRPIASVDLTDRRPVPPEAPGPPKAIDGGFKR